MILGYVIYFSKQHEFCRWCGWGGGVWFVRDWAAHTTLQFLAFLGRAVAIAQYYNFMHEKWNINNKSDTS